MGAGFNSAGTSTGKLDESDMVGEGYVSEHADESRGTAGIPGPVG